MLTNQLQRFYFTLILFAFFLNSYSQEKESYRNAVYIEFFGNAGTQLSVNYERLFKKNGIAKTNHLALRMGFSHDMDVFGQTSLYSFPIELNDIIRIKNADGVNEHFFEVGIGCATIFGTSDSKSSDIPNGFDNIYTLRLGYRLINHQRIVFRAAPLLRLLHDTPQSSSLKLGWTIGASVGYCFNFSKKHPSQTK